MQCDDHCYCCIVFFEVSFVHEFHTRSEHNRGGKWRIYFDADNADYGELVAFHCLFKHFSENRQLNGASTWFHKQETWGKVLCQELVPLLKHENRRTNDSEAVHSEAMPITPKTKLVHQGDKKSYWDGSNTDGDTSQPHDNKDNKKGKAIAGSDAGLNAFGMTTTRSYRDILIGEGRGSSN